MTGGNAHASAAWWVLIGFDQHGPWDTQQVLAAAAEGRIGPESLVWAAGMPEWAPVRTTALAPHFTPPPPPVTAAPPPVPAPPAPDPAEVAAPVDVAARVDPVDAPADPTALCPYCHTELGEDGCTACPGCRAPHHADCWAELAGCAVVGCDQAPSETPSPAAPPATAATPALATRGGQPTSDLGFFTARGGASPSSWAAPDPATISRPTAQPASPDWAPPAPETRR